MKAAPPSSAPDREGAAAGQGPTGPKELFGSSNRTRRQTPRPVLRAAKDRAALELSRGRFGEAFAAFVELAAEEPREGQWPLRAAEALRKLGRATEAVRFYHRAAVVFHGQGHLERATAVARIVHDLSGDASLLLQLDPGLRRPTR